LGDFRSPLSKSTDRRQHYLFICVVNQLNGICRTFTGAGPTSLALRRVDKGSTSQTTNPLPSGLLNNLGDAERAYARAGQAANASVRINLRDHATKVQRVV
jgi:hypothetical protein